MCFQEMRFGVGRRFETARRDAEAQREEEIREHAEETRRGLFSTLVGGVRRLTPAELSNYTSSLAVWGECSGIVAVGVADPALCVAVAGQLCTE